MTDNGTYQIENAAKVIAASKNLRDKLAEHYALEGGAAEKKTHQDIVAAGHEEARNALARHYGVAPEELPKTHAERVTANGSVPLSNAAGDHTLSVQRLKDEGWLKSKEPLSVQIAKSRRQLQETGIFDR